MFNGVPSAEGGVWSWVISESGTLEQLNLSAIITESNSTQSELKTDVIFYLYTASNPETAEVISVDDDDALSSSSFDPSLPTRIIIHGWQSSYQKTVVTSIRDGNYIIDSMERFNLCKFCSILFNQRTSRREISTLSRSTGARTLGKLTPTLARRLSPLVHTLDR